MTPLILRILGAVAELGSAVLCWFLGSALASPLRQGGLFSQSKVQYALLAFLFVPALILRSLPFSGSRLVSPAEARCPKADAGGSS